jgi:tetratricopeptide (TPR) repeat protein
LSAGRPAAALPLLERAVREGPKNAIARLNLGSARLALHDAAGSESCYREALELAPGLAAAWEGLARALREQGRGDEAREALARWLELEPGNARAKELAADLGR